LDWNLERLQRSAINEVVLAVNYMAEAFIQGYGDSAHGVKLIYSRETKPMRTGGPIKQAEEILGHDEPFLVLNGDIFTNINFAELIKKHKETKAIASIALYKVDDPSRYGIVETTERGRIVRFVEKPPPGKEPSNLANAGIYVLEPKIFDYIPGGRPVSLEREVFPILAQEGTLYGHDFEGFWTDIGEPKDYLKANRLLLSMGITKNQVQKTVNKWAQQEIDEPTVIGEDVVIGEGSKIGPYAAIADHVTLGRGVRIEDSIIFPGTTISDSTSIRGAIIGENATIGKWVKIESGCLIGDYAMIDDNVTLTKDVIVCPSKEISESVLTSKCLM
jgi:NDP-sugar pyrophosphorylase family protein